MILRDRASPGGPGACPRRGRPRGERYRSSSHAASFPPGRSLSRDGFCEPRAEVRPGHASPLQGDLLAVPPRHHRQDGALREGTAPRCRSPLAAYRAVSVTPAGNFERAVALGSSGPQGAGGNCHLFRVCRPYTWVLAGRHMNPTVPLRTSRLRQRSWARCWSKLALKRNPGYLLVQTSQPVKDPGATRQRRHVITGGNLPVSSSIQRQRVSSPANAVHTYAQCLSGQGM